MYRRLACVVLAAGSGSRMASDLPKPLHRVAGRTMLRHVLDALAALRPDEIVVVAPPGAPGLAIAEEASPWTVVEQPAVGPRGTAAAFAASWRALAPWDGPVLVAFGDTPLLTPLSLFRVLSALGSERSPAICATVMRPSDPGAYGRVFMSPGGDVVRIVESADASPDQLANPVCNGGLMAFDGSRMQELVGRVLASGSRTEFYLGDAIEQARAAGHCVAAVEVPEDDVRGVNDRHDLAAAEAVMQSRLRRAVLDGGATLLDPGSVWLSADTVVGRDVTIHQGVVLGPGVVLADGCEILPFSHLEGASVAPGAVVGPFARLRPGTDLAEGAKIGSFVETKNAQVGPGAKVNHLAYVGDAVVGAKANVGAGAVTCNYDGRRKHRTTIGPGAFVGSNSSLVAPVVVGEGAYVAAGSTVTRDVPAGSLAVARSAQKEVERWAARRQAANG